MFSATFLGFKERALEIDVLTSGYPIMGKSLMTKAVIGRHMIAFAESLPPEKAEVVMAQNGEVDLRETAGAISARLGTNSPNSRDSDTPTSSPLL